MQYTSIKKWPEDERPRERLLKLGANGLSTAELLAIIVKTGGRMPLAISAKRSVVTAELVLLAVELPQSFQY